MPISFSVKQNKDLGQIQMWQPIIIHTKEGLRYKGKVCIWRSKLRGLNQIQTQIAQGLIVIHKIRSQCRRYHLRKRRKEQSRRPRMEAIKTKYRLRAMSSLPATKEMLFRTITVVERLLKMKKMQKIKI